MSTPGLAGISICNASLSQLIWDNPQEANIYFGGISICGAKYRMLTIVDSSGSAIEGATITITDSGSYSETGTTDSSGVYSSFFTADEKTNPITIKVEKAGYTTFEQDFVVTNRIDWLIQMVDESSGGISIYVDLEQL